MKIYELLLESPAALATDNHIKVMVSAYRQAIQDKGIEAVAKKLRKSDNHLRILAKYLKTTADDDLAYLYRVIQSAVMR